MKKFKILLFLTALVTVFTQNSFARRAPTQPNSYDGAAPSARSMAMGEAGTGALMFNDAYYYNSAMYGYLQGTKAEVSGVIMRQSDAAPSSVAAVEPSGQGLTSFILVQNSAALIWQALSDCSISETYPGGITGNTEIYISALTLAAGQKNEKGYSVGINMTYLYGKIGESSLVGSEPYSNIGSGNGFALDLSFAVPAGNNVFFGIDVKNLAGFMFWNDYNTEQLPMIIRTGTGYHLKGFLFVTDWEKRMYRFGDLQKDYVRFGVEQYINGAVCIRLGLVSDDDFDTKTFKYTYGFGIRIKNYELSAAAQQYKINDENFTKYLLSFSALVQ
ncbi:MAG: hypothetical protein LBL00_00165 [Endomicrobium sp.]|jgi:hypothetical protein|nr:hypothetical protein [Endomicrobium sp.]